MKRAEREQKTATVNPLERFAVPLQLAVGVAVLIVYVSTLYPSVSGGDSGELIVAAYRLGVAHPPGYPLFTLAGKLATLLPVGTVAWRVNLLTALFGALAAAVLFRATWRMNRSLGAGLLTAGLFAFSPLVWRYAVGAEVFSLNNLFLAALIALLVSFEIERRDRTVYLFAFVLGLGLSNHQTLLFCGVPIGVWMLLRSRESLLRPVPLLKIAGAGLAGLTPYLYLFVRPSDHPLTTWGDTATFSGFWTHLRRAEYGSLQLAATGQEADLAQNTRAWLTQLPTELLWIGVPLALLALPLVRKDAGRQTMTVRALLITLVTYLLIFHSLSNMPLDQPLYREILSRFWQLPNMIVCVLAGTGLWWLVRRKLGMQPLWVALIALGLVGAQAGVHYAAEDQSDNTLIADLARRTLQVFPPQALVISRGDLYWNSLRYTQVCEGVRLDVIVLDQEMLETPWMAGMVRRHFPQVTLPGEIYRLPTRKLEGSYDLGQLFDANFASFPIMSNALEEGDGSWSTKYVSWPVGFYDRVYMRGARIDIDAYLSFTDEWATVAAHDFPPTVRAGSWEAVARSHYADFEGRRGTRLLGYAVSNELPPEQLHRAGRILQHALEIDDDPSPNLHLNMGIYYYLQRGKEAGAVEKMVGAWMRFLTVAPADSPEARTVQKALEDPENAQLGIGSQ